MDDKTTFGAWLKDRRQQLDLTQKELAYQAGCSVGTIRKIEADERRPSRQLAALLARYLDIPPEHQEAFVAFARAEAYTAEVAFPVPSLDDQSTAAMPDIPQRPAPYGVANNLPAETTSFIGREVELAALAGLLRSQEHRLVTIVGPGGIGKTRLALACAAQQIEGIAQASQIPYPQGVFFIDLVPLGDAESLIMILAETLGFQLQDGEQEKRPPKQQLLDYLRSRRLLLLLDNFEHLLEPYQMPDTGSAASLVAEILGNAPEVQILVTSRERLNLPMEQLFPINGLVFPDEAAAALEEQEEDITGYTARYTSMQLFLQSAQRNKPNFALENSAELAALIRICRLVEGIPLAIELAGSWVDVLSIIDIAAELQQGLDILETEQRYLPYRQRSMLATFDYSWQRLGEKERIIFAQLSIFRGGFSRPAAMAVTGATLRQLSRLVNKSFIQFSKMRDRYQVHELMRQYGSDKLSQDRELEKAVRKSHSTYYCRTLAALTEDLKGTGQKQALSTIEVDIDNVRLAWNHALTHQDLDAIDISLESLFRYFWTFLRFMQAEKLLEKAAKVLRTGQADASRELVLGRVLARLGFCYIGRDWGRAFKLGQESLDLLQRIGAWQETFWSLIVLAECLDSLEDSNVLLEKALSVARDSDNRWAVGDALIRIGETSRLLGEYDKAERTWREALQQFQQNRDPGGIAYVLFSLSILAGHRGLYREALALAQEAYSLGTHANKSPFVMEVLGGALMDLGAYKEAEAQFQQALTTARKGGKNTLEMSFLLGRLAFHTGDYSLARRHHQESLAAALELNYVTLVAQNHDALGMLKMAEANRMDARKHFRAALQACLTDTHSYNTFYFPGRIAVLLACLASIAELFDAEGRLADAAWLAMLIMNHSASQAKDKERGARLLDRFETQVPAIELDNLQVVSRQSNLNEVANQLLEDLETS